MTGTNLPVTSYLQSWIFLLVICLFSLVIGNDCLQEFGVNLMITAALQCAYLDLQLQFLQPQVNITVF